MSGQTLLIKNADILCTMAPSELGNLNDASEIKNGGLFIRDGVIEHVAESSQLPTSADTVLDLTGPNGKGEGVYNTFICAYL